MTNFSTQSTEFDSQIADVLMADFTHDEQAQSLEPSSEAVDGFAALGLNKPLLKALQKSGYDTPTPIQAQAIPYALAGRDLLLSAQTGSGKTAAFTLPVLDKLSRAGRLEKHIYALILTPTRELAQQVHDSIRRYGGNLRGVYSVPLVGGTPYGGQIRALRKGVQVVVATPGRLIDHLREGRVDLSQLEMLILDEADRMLDMGFADDIKEILDNTPSTRQTVMSSATWDGAVGKIAESFTTNPECVSIAVESAHIEESVYFCDDYHHKNKILLEILNNPEMKQAVIFAATKMSTEKLADQLVEAGHKARYLHGDLPQAKRNRIVSEMKSGKCNLLIATDVAARGIDISAISHVVNYDLPRQVEDYVHRIGRCGRAGRTGVAMNLCSRDDFRQLQNINRYLDREMSEAVIEGLEPKNKPRLQKRDDKRKGGKFGKSRRFENEGGREARGERKFARSRSRDFDKSARHFEKDARSEGGFEKKAYFADKPRRERKSTSSSERFERNDRHERFERAEKDYHSRSQHRREFGGRSARFDSQRGFDHAGKSGKQGLYRADGEFAPRSARGERQIDRSERFGKGGFAKDGFAKADKFGGKSGKFAKNDKFAKSEHHKPSRKKAAVVEEVFGTRRRKFGNA